MPTRTTKKSTKRNADLNPEAFAVPAWVDAIPDEGETPIQPIQDALLVPMSRVQPTSNQPRSEFEDEALQELAKDIKERGERGEGVAGTGILQPILVRYAPGAVSENGVVNKKLPLLITAGERRFRAAGLAKLELVPIIISDQSSESAFEAALAENIHRRDLSPLEEARAFRYLMNLHDLSFNGLAEKLYGNVSKKGYIQNRMDVLNAGEDVQKIIDERPDSLSIARRIETVKQPEDRAELIEMALKGASFKEIDKHVKSTRAPRIYGTPKTKGVTVAPRLELLGALDSIIRQLASVQDAVKPMKLPAPLRRELKEKLRAARARLDTIEDSIAS